LLDRILRGSRATARARDLGLAAVRSYEDLRQRLPLVGYEQLSPYVQRIEAGEARVLTREPVVQLLQTSGTTGAAKLIPVTASWARGVSEAQKIWLLGLLREHEGLAQGAALTLVSPAQERLSRGGIPIGSNTGRMHLAQPWWVRRRYPVPYEVYTLPDPELRLYAILRFALQAPLRSITTANPTTVLLIARKLREHADALACDLRAGSLQHGPARALDPVLRRQLAGQLRRVQPPQDWRPARIWPLEVINCWKGGLAAWFLPLLGEALGAPVPVREVGISASESFVAVPLASGWPGCVAWPLGELLEFVADDGSVQPLWRLDMGAEYRLVVSGRHGLLRYDLGDRLRVVGRYHATPVLSFLRRSGSVLSATGEKLTETQLLLAMERVFEHLGLPRAPFTLRLVMAETPWYELATEHQGDADLLGREVERALLEVNVEYASKRSTGRLGPLRPLRLPPGSYRQLRRQRVAAGTPEGQYKDPAMCLDQASWQALMAAASTLDSASGAAGSPPG